MSLVSRESLVPKGLLSSLESQADIKRLFDRPPESRGKCNGRREEADLHFLSLIELLQLVLSKNGETIATRNTLTLSKVFWPTNRKTAFSSISEAKVLQRSKAS